MTYAFQDPLLCSSTAFAGFTIVPILYSATIHFWSLVTKKESVAVQIKETICDLSASLSYLFFYLYKMTHLSDALLSGHCPVKKSAISAVILSYLQYHSTLLRHKHPALPVFHRKTKTTEHQMQGFNKILPLSCPPGGRKETSSILSDQ